MLNQAIRDATANRPVPVRWPSWPSPSEAVLPPSVPKQVSFSDPLVSTPSYQEQPSERLGTVFSQPCGGGGCMPRAGCSFPASTAAVPAVPVGTASENRPLSLPPLRPVLVGEPCGWLLPWTQTGSSWHRTAAHHVQSAPCTINSLACIYSAMYSGINQYPLKCCLYTMSTLSNGT
jgi:hypothetical protein